MWNDFNEQVAKAKGHPALEARLILRLRYAERRNGFEIGLIFGRKKQWVRRRIRLYGKAQKRLNTMNVKQLTKFAKGR